MHMYYVYWYGTYITWLDLKHGNWCDNCNSDLAEFIIFWCIWVHFTSAFLFHLYIGSVVYVCRVLVEQNEQLMSERCVWGRLFVLLILVLCVCRLSEDDVQGATSPPVQERLRNKGNKVNNKVRPRKKCPVFVYKNAYFFSGSLDYLPSEFSFFSG